MVWVGDEKVAMETVISHLQVQYALQQLTMEIYNDALEEVASIPAMGDEALSRGLATVSDLSLVETYLIPASQRVASIAETMVREHRLVKRPIRPPEASEMLEQWSEFLHVFTLRAQSRLGVFRNWVRSPSAHSLDGVYLRDELVTQTFLAFNLRFNALIEQVGIPNDQWISINRRAINSVRGRLGLEPLSESAFTERLSDGLAVGHPRYFR